MSYHHTTRRSPARALVAGVKVLVVLLAWVGATAFGLYVAAEVPLGRVVLMLSATHGVHLGDLVAFGVGYAVAAMVTIAAFLVPRPAHRRTHHRS